MQITLVQGLLIALLRFYLRDLTNTWNLLCGSARWS